MAQADEELAAAAQGGDREAFAVLVDRHQQQVYQKLWRMVGSEQDAQDLAQDVFLKCYRNLSGYRQEAAFSTWLYRLTLNTGLDWLRARKIRPLEVPLSEPTVQLDGVEAGAIRNERREQMLKALQGLPLDYREVIQFRHYHHLSYEEIAERVGIPVRTVETRLYRARGLLRKALTTAERGDRHELQNPSPTPRRVLG